MIAAAFFLGVLCGVSAVLALALYLAKQPKQPQTKPHVPSAIGYSPNVIELQGINKEWLDKIFEANRSLFELRRNV